MGYFKLKLRRSSARDAAVRFAWAAVADWHNATPSPPPAGFVRLVVGPGREGLFSAAYELKDSSELEASEHADLISVLRWFERKLKPHAPTDPAAVFWFRADATEHVRRIWNLVRHLQQSGREVLMLHARRPGRIVHQDEYQVAAIPPRTGRPIAKRLSEVQRTLAR